jgi:U3 small nucleolar RNA-associated protein 14
MAWGPKNRFSSNFPFSYWERERYERSLKMLTRIFSF